ncbi:hypothetical protein BC828DRAFT_440959 [Blastocladiella britannica]|nr:hypothetical protein BC828DRAFT_440959 [Blastocladiella britannica]
MTYPEPHTDIFRGRSPVRAATADATTTPSRRHIAPVGASSLHISGIYGFGTAAPEYLLAQSPDTSFTSTPVPRGRKAAKSAHPGRGRSPNPIEWDDSTETRTKVLRDLATATVSGSKRRAKSVPPGTAGRTAPLLAHDPTVSHEPVATKKRGNYKVPGGPPYSFKLMPSPASGIDGLQPDPSAVDPLTVYPKSGSGDVSYIPSARRLRRPASSTKLDSANSSGAGASLAWKEE